MATLRKRGEAWHLRWSEGGIEKSASIGKISKAEAEQIRKQKEREIARRKLDGVVELPKSAGPGPRLMDYAVGYLAWHAAEYPDSTSRIEGIFRKYLVPEFGFMPLVSITKTAVGRYKQTRMMAAKAATVSKEMHALMALMNHAKEDGVILSNPLEGLRYPKLVDAKPPRWYSQAELDKLYAVAGDYAPVWRLIANLGLRRMEAMYLRREDIGPEGARIWSEAGRRTKSGKFRVVPLSAGAKAALVLLPQEGYLVPRIHRWSLSRAFSAQARRAGIDGALHALRHTFGAQQAMAGVPLYTIQKLMGHANMKTTEIYTHLSPEYMRRAVRISL